MLTDKIPRAAHLFGKLQNFVRLSREDLAALERIAQGPLRETEPRRDLIREGDDPKVMRLVVSGWACHYKGLPDGRRQIVGFFVPGDFCDFNVYILKQMDHSIGAITRVEYVAIPPDEMDRIIEERPRIARAFWWQELVNASVQREWLLNLGQRSAYERIAHLLVELFVRLRAVGLTNGRSCSFPITQTDLAEATGLTSVHINRTLRELREAGLIEHRQKRLTIHDLDRLMEDAMFNPNYLHLDYEGQHRDANC